MGFMEACNSFRLNLKIPATVSRLSPNLKAPQLQCLDCDQRLLMGLGVRSEVQRETGVTQPSHFTQATQRPLDGNTVQPPLNYTGTSDLAIAGPTSPLPGWEHKQNKNLLVLQNPTV